MTYTYFADRDLGRSFVTRVRDAGFDAIEGHYDHFPGDVADEEWLGFVGRSGWIALTHDKRIRYVPNEREAVRRHGVQLIVLIGKPHSRLADNFVASRSRIERFLTNAPKPSISKLYFPTKKSHPDSKPRSGRIELWWHPITSPSTSS